MKTKTFTIFLVLFAFVLSHNLFTQPEKTDPVNWRKLVTFLTDIKGWEAQGEARGSTNTMGQFKISEASRNYKSQDKKLKIKIIDASYSPMTMQGLKAAANFEVDNSEGYMKKIKIGDYMAIEEYKNKRQRAKLVVFIADRFILTLEERKVKDTEELKDILELLNLKELAALAK